MTSHLIVVENPERWQFELPDVRVISARDYLANKDNIAAAPRVRVVNLCRSYRYQSLGYYVSLLAEARGHKPLPKVTTVQDVKSLSIIRTISSDIEDGFQKAFAKVAGDTIKLSILFAKTEHKGFERLARQIFNALPSPMLEAEFKKTEDGWILHNVSFLSIPELPEGERAFFGAAAAQFFKKQGLSIPKIEPPRYHIAILYDEEDTGPKASNARALRNFIRAAEDLDMECEILSKDDYGRIGEFDALFIRDTTAVNHYTFRFAQKAEREGLVVMDDPHSILKCANKVFLAELMTRHKVPTPKTVLLVKENLKNLADLPHPFPFVLKKPDSSFSQGVVKVTTPEEYREKLNHLLQSSEMVVAQEFCPTDYDWRIGTIDRKAIYACRYHMAPSHWQIYNHARSEQINRSGRSECIPLDLVPPVVLRTALKAANAIGDGFYGVDLKQYGDRCLLIEVNDNPSVDAGVEDVLLREQLYANVMKVFLKRLDEISLADTRPEEPAPAAPVKRPLKSPPPPPQLPPLSPPPHSLAAPSNGDH